MSSTQFTTGRYGLTYDYFDGELLVVDYISGSYYSISKIGAVIWKALGAGYTPDEILERLGAFPQAAGLADALPGFLATLEAEKLIEPRAASAERGEWPAVSSDDLGPLTFERFEDLKDLLLLDPVHEVDQQGWPHRAG
jgi:hypothetical protein